MRNVKTRMNVFFAVYLFLILILPIQAYSADVTLAWDKNPESNIAGYRVFSRQNNQGYNYLNPDWEGSGTQCTLTGLTDNTDYFFVVRAFTIAGTESRNSNEVFYNSAYKTFSRYSNNPPIADAGPDQVRGKGESVFLNGLNSFDPDDGIVTYAWTQIKGTPVALSNSADARVKFASPEIFTDETLVFKLTVTDNFGNRSSDTCLVTVTENNIPPSSEAGETQAVLPGDVVVLDGSGSFDPDDGIYYYKWVQLTGRPVEISNPYEVKTAFIAHDIESKGESLLFELQVTDQGGLFSTDTVIVNITGGSVPPVVETISGLEIFEGDTVVLDTYQAVDPSDAELLYRWKQIAGPPVVLSDTDSAAPGFVAPQVHNNETPLVFVVSVENADGLVSTAEIIIIVKEKGDFGFPDDAIPITSAYGDILGVKIEGDGSLTRIEAMLPDEVDNSDNKPDSMLYGLFEFEVKVAHPGERVSVIFFLPEIFPEGCQWYKYSENFGGWYDFTENVSFSSSREQMVMTLTDGGTGDDDSSANGIIINDPSGFAFGPGYRKLSGVSSDDGSSGGCFIGSGFGDGSMISEKIKAAFSRWSKKIASILQSFRI